MVYRKSDGAGKTRRLQERFIIPESLYGVMLAGAVHTYKTGVERSYNIVEASVSGGDYFIESLSKLPSNSLPMVRRGNGQDFTGYYLEGSSIPGNFHTHPPLPFYFRYFSVTTEKDFLKIDPIIAANILNSQIISPSGNDWKTFLQREFAGILCYLGKDRMVMNCYHNNGGNNFTRIPVYRLDGNKLIRVPSKVSSRHVGKLFDIAEFHRQVYEPVIFNSGTAEVASEFEDGTVKNETIDDFRIVSRPGTGLIGYMPIAKDQHGNHIQSPITSYCAGV